MCVCVPLVVPHSNTFVISPQRNIVTDNMNKALLIHASSFLPSLWKADEGGRKNQINSTFEQNIIWSTVNNFGGSSLVKSLLWGEKAEGFFFYEQLFLLHQVFVYTFIRSLLHYLMPPSRFQSRSHSVLISPLSLTAPAHRGRRGERLYYCSWINAKWNALSSPFHVVLIYSGGLQMQEKRKKKRKEKEKLLM